MWRFVRTDEPDESWVVPLAGRRVSSFTAKIVGTEVTLADGSRLWALFGNVDPANPELTEHFLSASFFVNRKWFHLARYHDVDVEKRGPRALASALNRRLSDVFPIQYDLRPFARGNHPALANVIRQRPRKRLTRAQVIALAVR